MTNLLRSDLQDHEAETTTAHGGGGGGGGGGTIDVAEGYTGPDPDVVVDDATVIVFDPDQFDVTDGGGGDAYINTNVGVNDLADYDAGAFTDGDTLVWHDPPGLWSAEAPPSGVTDHGALTGLGDDDHPQYTTAGEATTLADASVATHAGLGDPHTGYRLESADHTHAATGIQAGTIDHGVLTGLADDDHPQYETSAEVDTKVATHAGLADPHTGYRLESADHTHATTGLQAGTLDHGTALTGLGDDDHPQYALDTDLTTHAGAADPHTGYLKESVLSEANAVDLTDGGATVLHSHAGGALTDFAPAVLTPADISADQNNYAPAGIADATTIRLRTNNTTLRTLTGLDATQAAGQVLIIHNVGANGVNGTITLSNENTNSTAANRFQFRLDMDMVIPIESSCILVYDAVQSRWIGQQTPRVADSASPPANIIVDAAATGGLSDVAQGSGHEHRLNTYSSLPLVESGVGSAGTATTAPARGDHVHPAAAGAAPAYTNVVKDLGAAKQGGTFDITGLSGLTANKPVNIFQSASPITSKGDARDEAEMDHISATGYVVNTTTIRVYWNAPSIVVGNYEFEYSVGG